MATGVFGGSFDPVHLGHLIAADRAAEALGLEKVWFVPARAQPLKGPGPVATGEQRRRMLELAVAGDARFGVEPLELERDDGGPSYTVDTLRALQSRWPGERLVLLLGADAAADLPRWREAEEIARLAEVAILTRPGAGELRTHLARHVVAIPAIEISSSEIRARRALGKAIRYLVPASVAEYIEREELYR